jgi:hypothetical protein
MQEALCHDFEAGFADHPIRQFVQRAATLLLQLGLEELEMGDVTSFDS